MIEEEVIMEFFATLNEGGSYDLTFAGYIILAIVIVAVFLVGCLLLVPRQKMGARQVVFSAMAIALAVVTSNIKLIHMPMGGSVTLLSMLFVVLIANWYGLGAGLCCSIAYGFLQMLMGPYIISIPQLFVDYVLAFGALGLAGIFYKNKRKGLLIGYVFGVLCRLFFSTLSGVLFFADYASSPEVPALLNGKPFLYSLAYNGAYMITELVLTVIIISIKPVSAALDKVKIMAVPKEEPKE